MSLSGVFKKYNSSGWFGTGHIIIPPDQEGAAREEYVRTCIKKNTVSVLVDEGGGIAHECKIAKPLLRDVEFPESFGKTGSPVLFYKHPMRRSLIVLQVFTKENEGELLEEEERIIKGETKDGLAEIGVRGKKGQAYINIDSELEDGGTLFINVRNKSRNGKLNVRVLGESNWYILGEHQLRAKEITLRARSGDTELNLKNGGIEIKNEEESLKDLIGDLIAEIGKITVPTPAGTSGVPINLVQLQDIAMKFNKLLK